ncbi:hypothetical protein FB388_2349 [Pseudonocardia cypriaca]|uniref:Uncharacterized protein n=1 Tax=Pseudonocardia cypriaca TaxID=882449 RepID=A0A543GFV3_9PSEU|nr:hypothetical protein FB388_2349 [Pseudonocardia cypriaca]
MCWPSGFPPGPGAAGTAAAIPAGCTIGVVEAGPPNAPREGRGDDVLAENEEMYR